MKGLSGVCGVGWGGVGWFMQGSRNIPIMMLHIFIDKLVYVIIMSFLFATLKYELFRKIMRYRVKILCIGYPVKFTIAQMLQYSLRSLLMDRVPPYT